MAGRKKKTALQWGDGPEHLTVQHYNEGWKLYATGATAGQIRRALNITGKQLHHLVTVGLEGRGNRSALPSYQSRALEEAASTRVAATEAGAVISVRGVEVLGEQLENARNAGTIVSMLLQIQQEKLEAELDKPAADRNWSSAALPDNLQALLRTLRPYTDLRPATQAFRAMYDAHPVEQYTHRNQIPTEAIDVEAHPRLPAALAYLEEVSGDGAGAVFVSELAKQMEGWTDDEKLRYATTGEEPAG